MPNADSIDKIVETYFAAVTSEPFEYKKKTYHPKPLIVSHHIVRGYTCPAHCGGCCNIKFTLDYLPAETPGKTLTSRTIDFNHHKIKVFSDMQKDNPEPGCRNLRMADGRCSIHGYQPFTCDFELIRFLHYKDQPNRVLTRLYGRGWNMLRVDGERGALCEILPPEPESIMDTIRKLQRLKDWTDHFGIKTIIPEIITWIQNRGFMLGDMQVNLNEKGTLWEKNFTPD